MIFISYRRQDSQAEARNIWMVLKEAYRERDGEKDSVFFDRDAIRAGDRWAREIAEKLKLSTLVIAVIGSEWLTCQDEYGRRRLDDPEDWVRKEIHYALEHNITIIPALIRDARMPPRDSLPDVLKGLCDWQAVRLTEENWERDVLSILDRIRVDHLPVPSILLTSRSPRRKELLRQIGWHEGMDYYAVHASVHLDEDTENPRLESCIQYAEDTARAKINYVATDWPRLRSILGTDINLADTIVVGVDTIAVCDNQILDTPLRRAIEFAGPQDFEDARNRAFEMLRQMRGKKIKMITSIAAALANDLQHPVTQTTITDAKLRDYSEEDIASYINSAEPYDKAGAFGIQEKGVALFEGIAGSYSNIVGLPVREFISLLQEHFGDRFLLPTFQSVIGENGVAYSDPEFSALCMGDINYDFVYDKLPEDFFIDLKAPGKKVTGGIRRGAGGTAVNFAKGAREAGFTSCVVVGVVGGDALGLEIEDELARLGITPLLPRDPAEETSIAIILRNQAKKDISITLTDANQSLPNFVVERARSEIEKADVFYCSGYSLIDDNRKENAIRMLELARDAQCIAILDVVVHMDSRITYDEISRAMRPKRRNARPKGIIVSEFPEIFRWFNIPFEQGAEVDAWTQHRESIAERLREDFAVAILRTSNYTHEAIITSHAISELFELDYSKIAHAPRRKVGYADFRTAQQVFSFLSPRIVMASKSPQRLDLLCQLMAPKKIQVRISEVHEDHIARESPYVRVKRLALAKAEDVLARGDFSDSIEFIIGADTEIILKDPASEEWQMIGHPTTIKEAEENLRYLSGKTHIAVTGMAIIGVDPATGEKKTVVDAVETRVTLATLSDREIEEYAASGEPLGRAGAYAIQGLGIRIIERIEGSYSNVVGLPLERLAEILSTEFNRPVWTFDKVSDWNFPIPIKQAVQAPTAK